MSGIGLTDSYVFNSENPHTEIYRNPGMLSEFLRITATDLRFVFLPNSYVKT